jgi:hypothetical protein
MSKKSQSPLAKPPDDVKELEHLYAQLAAVQELIRALEVYREFSPISYRSNARRLSRQPIVSFR